MMTDDTKWTAKLPALAAGVVLILAGIWTASRPSRRAAMIAAALILLGLLFAAYSFTIKDWCEVKAAPWGSLGFGQHSFGDCLKSKHWLRL